MNADSRTLAVYDAKASEYAARFGSDRPDRHLQSFIDALPKGACVLDLGCGPGDAAAFMRAAGLAPDPVDGSAEMVRLANAHHAIRARLATFDEIDGVAIYDGIWANFSLLHAARGDVPGHLASLHRAMRPVGLFHIGMKTGTGEARDTLDRFYTYYSRDELLGLLGDAGFTVTSIEEGAERGLAGTLDPWIVMRAHA
ncbi:hypothetical protein DEA8626_00093 [Defluviimonas aquaemixtae]|uniref:Trans-aconitate 2-methyltransferase n=1 Tax=Albidovulum aquaemixtae TaxID=1542388 RepID=A0A2R8B1X6_9RHOB|nr:class I SAM-dependent methyltransferase [Defluviimonas aquaemixtae]SPH16583.1 hypothetical protein DEA8626_00093 [Defluviimonas aquaemixtae]